MVSKYKVANALRSYGALVSVLDELTETIVLCRVEHANRRCAYLG
jgi:hypothetical protein